MPNKGNQDSYSWPSIKQPLSIKWPVNKCPKINAEKNGELNLY